MKIAIALITCLTGACAATRSPPVTYSDACGSHVECFTRGLENLAESYRQLEEARKLALTMAPVGSVAAYSGSVEPPGWMFCDGRALDKNDPRHSALFDVVGVTHGGDASPSFQIPDYRGVFLRGVNGGSGRDPDAARRTAAGKDGAGNAGDTVGSRQADALQTHRHAVTWDFYAVGTNRTRDVEEGDEKLNAHTNERFSLSVLDPTGARTSSETRPVNVAVHWMIKAR